MAKEEDLLRLITLIPFLTQHPGVTLKETANFLHTTEKIILNDLDKI